MNIIVLNVKKDNVIIVIEIVVLLLITYVTTPEIKGILKADCAAPKSVAGIDFIEN